MRVRNGARHHEDMTDVVRLDLAGSLVAPLHALELPVALEADDDGPRVQDDRGIVLDAPNQVSRHRVG